MIQDRTRPPGRAVADTDPRHRLRTADRRHHVPGSRLHRAGRAAHQRTTSA